MTFLFSKKDGTFGVTSTDINYILNNLNPDDIIDNMDSIGIKLNRYYENMSNSVTYILWITQSKKASVKAYKNGIEEDAEEWAIRQTEIEELHKFFLM